MADPTKTEEQIAAEIAQKKDELAAKHGTTPDRIHRLCAGGYEIYVRAPGRPQWKRFTQGSARPEQRMEALEVLTMDCLLEPDRKAFAAILDDKPALGVVFGDELAHIAGAAEVVEKNA